MPLFVPTRRARERLLVGIGIVMLLGFAVGLYEALWGKLTPFSPIILGFQRREMSHVILYVQRGNAFGEFEWIDSIIPGIEAFHDLKFHWKPKILLFADKAAYLRRSITRARLCAYPNGAVVVSPWVQQEDAENKVSLRVYLTHELSHSLLYENMTALAGMRYPPWLLEGIATFSASQMGTPFYLSKEETLDAIRQGNWMPPTAFKKREGNRIISQVENPATFPYTEFAVVVDDLITRFGKDTFLNYMKALLTNSDHDKVFKACFGMSFEEYLSDYRASVTAIQFLGA